MGKIFGVLIICLIIGVWEIVPITRRRKTGEIVTYAVLWAVALLFSLMLVAGVKFPSFELWMTDIFKSMGTGG